MEEEDPEENDGIYHVTWVESEGKAGGDKRRGRKKEEKGEMP